MLAVFWFVICHSLVGTLSWAHNLFCSDVSVSGLINDTNLLSPCLALSVSSFRAHLYVPISLASNRIQPHHPRQLWVKKKKIEYADKKSNMRIRFGRRFTNKLTNAVGLFSNRSQITPNCGKNKKVAQEAQLMVMFFPHFDVSWHLLLCRPTASWNLFLYDNKAKNS